MKKLHKSIFLTSSVVAALPVYAENIQQPVTSKLSEVVVYGQQNTGLSSTQKITSKEIAKAPTSNGNISDYLKSNSHIRFENSDETSLMRGEIKPADISINGAEESQTSYYIDNVNINNDLGNNNDGIFDGTLPQLPQIQSGQGYFFDANLLSSVVVHDSNISATLGGFSGGAVVAKTKFYDGKDRVKLRYRTTRSQWTKFNIHDDNKEKFEDAKPVGFVAEYQPKYDKNFFSLSGEKSLTNDLGMVFGISRRTASIQQQKPMTWDDLNYETVYGIQNVKRRSDNILLNFNYTPSDNNRFELSLRHSNYKEEKFHWMDFKNNISDYHNGYGTTLAWIHSLDNGVLTSTLAYDYMNDKRKSNTNHKKVNPINYAIEGALGNSELSQKNIHLSSEYAINPFDLGNTTHSISLGGLYQSTHYKFNREQDAIAEDFFGTTIYKKGTVKAKYQNIALYAEDLIRAGNFEFRPGIRVERDNFLKNTNIAPRFVANWSPLETTSMSLGLNRYYGRSFASMALTEQVYKLDGNYGQDNEFRYQNVSSFKTPYSDELSLGFNQQYKNVMFNVGFIHRKNKNRIILSEKDHPTKTNMFGDPIKYKFYEKGSDYNADIYTLQLSNIDTWNLGKTYWNTSLSFDWLNTDTVSYSNLDLNKPVVLDGKLMTLGEMRNKMNNSRENWTVRLGLDMTVPDYNIDWTNNVYIKSPIKGIKDVEGVSGAYESYDYGTHVQWDTSVRWSPKFGKHSPYIKFDVLNVLNNTRKDINDKFYSIGREFWLELGYEF